MMRLTFDGKRFLGVSIEVIRRWFTGESVMLKRDSRE